MSTTTLKLPIELAVNGGRYENHHASTRHAAPLAQDFKAAFGVGETDTGITAVDADGVALAAIQGLNQKLEEQRTENTDLKRRVAELERLVLKLSGQGE